MSRDTADVILLGDSIRMGYQPAVARALDGITRVWGPVSNCYSSRHLRTVLDAWVLDTLTRPAVVHLNAGAHDVRRMQDTAREVQIPLGAYRTNMESIVSRLLAHEHVVRVVIATTTPVVESRHQALRPSWRYNQDIVDYNATLTAVADGHSLAVNDLWAVVNDCPFDPIADDGIHLTPQGYDYLGAHVAHFLIPLL